MSAAIGQRHLAIVETAGDPLSRGRQHGEQVRSTIATGVEAWRASIERRHGLPASDYIAEFLGNTGFVGAIEIWTPGLLDEVRGIAEGAGQPYETMLAYNLMDEEWQYAGERARTDAPGCTAACLLNGADGAPVIAQTMDLPAVHDGTQTALIQKPDNGPAHALFTAAGMLGLNGANEAGIGVVVNNLSVLPWSRSGLPVMFLLRGILARTTLADAADFVTRSPHAVGQHYLIGSPEGVASFEGSARKVVRDRSTSEGRFVHANHPLVSDPVLGDHSVTFNASNTFIRQARAEELIETATDRAGIEALLADDEAPISRSPLRGGMTLGATSIVCSTPPQVRIAPGPPHLEPWVTVSLA